MNPSETREHVDHQRSSSVASIRPSSSASIRPPSSASRRPPSTVSIRPASSVSLRPPSSFPTRPSSSASSVRPPTSLSTRPSSSASSLRPSPSANSRPSSRMTQRAPSRLTQRSSTRQSSRLLSLYQTLVTQLTDITAENDEDNFRTAVDFVSKYLDQTARPAGSADIAQMEKHLRGYAQKARIMSEDSLANALDEAHNRLKAQARQTTDLDSEINASRFPYHLHLLLLLSEPPDKETLKYADDYLENLRNPPKPATGLTWKDILAEEPFEGQHWEGAYGLPPGSTVENWETHSGGSSPSLSPLDDDLDNLDDSLSSLESGDPLRTPPSSPSVDAIDQENTTNIQYFPTYSHRDDVEELQTRQYWRPEWRLDVSLDRPFNIKDASTFGPAFQRALGDSKNPRLGNNLIHSKYIYEHDAIREVLMGLQGRRNLMISWTNIGNKPFCFIPSPQCPGLLHLTSTGLHSMLDSFARVATVLEHLRKFITAIFAKASRIPVHTNQPSHLAYRMRRSTRTLEAFCEAVDSQVRQFDSWCADKEEAMCRAQAGVEPDSPLVVSLLSLDMSIRDKFSESFSVILDILRRVVQRATRSPEPITEIWTFPDLPSRMAPSALTALLLDSLLLGVRECSSMGDIITSQVLMRVFSDTAEPLWTMIGHWLKDGMPVREVAGPLDSYGHKVDEEFFIEDNELAILDPDFWADGFVLRDGDEYDGEEISRSTAVPFFLTHSAGDTLSAGKAIGLLRAMGMSSTFERDNQTGHSWLSKWPSFKRLLDQADGTDTNDPVHDGVISGHAVNMSTDDFARLVYEELLKPCKLAQELLTRVLIDECDIWLHLSAMEDLFLMRRGDAISNFVDVLFARMDSPQPWDDFHFLNSAFCDVVVASQTSWIDPSLVRFSHRGSKDKSISRTVRAIDGLLIEYAVPFPLTYIFGPRTMQVYSSIFAFVLQIRRAKNALEKILVRGALANIPHVGSELKMFYAMRGKLSWFVNALLNFVCTNVLHAQVLAFHKVFKEAKSLDDMITLHDAHLGKLEGRCLLQRNTSALHRAVISILDMTLHFSDCFVAFAGDTTHDISRQSLILMKRHRSRRQKRQRKNIIGFSQSLRQAQDESSDSDSDAEDELSIDNGPEPSFSLAASSISFAEESFYVRLDKMSSELDALVRFIRRGVESLAGGTGEAAPAFGVFAFALEDWDR